MIFENFQAIKDIGSVISTFQQMAKSEANKSTEDAIKQAQINIENEKKQKEFIKSIFATTNLIIFSVVIILIIIIYFLFRNKEATGGAYIDMTTTEI